MELVIDFADLNLSHLDTVGGKNASLGEMIQNLSSVGVKVPPGFATTSDAFKQFLHENDLGDRIKSALAKLDVHNIQDLKATGKQIRSWIMENPLSAELQQAIQAAYKELNPNEQYQVAVRSSATSEDLPEASFAGQQETFLNVTGIDSVLHCIKAVFASLYTDRAISYRVDHDFDHDQIAISAGIQRMVRSDCGVSGVAFSIDTESGFDQVVLITGSYGLGEGIVSGAVNPDEFYVYKPALKAGKQSILRRNLGGKALKIVYADDPSQGNFIENVEVPMEDRLRFCMSDQDLETLAQKVVDIENHYAKPMDVEWAKDGIDGEIYILQARPETVQSRQNTQTIEQFELLERSEVLAEGRSIGQKIGQGRARLIKSPEQMEQMQAGEVLVTDMTDPDWEPIMKIASGIVTNRGGRTCHAAIIARELGIPAIVGCGDATKNISAGEMVTVACSEGDTGYVYAGKCDYSHKVVEVDQMPDLPFKICLNLGNPDKAFAYHSLPNSGVGLARLEFIISNMIGIHPQALFDLDKLEPELQQQIRNKTAAYADPIEYYVERIKEGVATIAAASYPNPVIVRLSDFKSNEYANLIGGPLYEPDEENPMLGFRGASRYVSNKFERCFALECHAMKRVREEMGLTNAHIMIPFVRTVDEAKNVVQVLEKYGLKRGENDLELYMMCEIPSNALLAEEFLPYFDGFSIGSNDLTQLTLGLDRDSSLVAEVFDERNAAVKALLKLAIDSCNKAGKYVGICGQGPSDHPDLAKWLMDQGISAVSLSPDSVIKTWLFLAEGS